MNLKEIKDIIDLMNENSLGEIEIEREGLKIKVRKSSSGAPVAVQGPPQYTVEQIPSTQTAVEAPAAEPAKPAASGSGQEIKAPMVGTFYRSPSPEAAPFVEIGQTVEVGQVVCIIEAMKLMNEIKSEVRGKIVEVAVDNAEPVEFGQALYVIEPV